jgi:hypothetical protein
LPQFFTKKLVGTKDVSYHLISAASEGHLTLKGSISDHECQEIKNRTLAGAASKVDGPVCMPEVDGFFVMLIGGTILGVLWVFLMRRFVLNLQDMPLSKWRVRGSRRGSHDSEEHEL